MISAVRRCCSNRESFCSDVVITADPKVRLHCTQSYLFKWLSVIYYYLYCSVYVQLIECSWLQMPHFNFNHPTRRDLDVLTSIMYSWEREKHTNNLFLSKGYCILSKTPVKNLRCLIKNPKRVSGSDGMFCIVGLTCALIGLWLETRCFSRGFKVFLVSEGFSNYVLIHVGLRSYWVSPVILFRISVVWLVCSWNKGTR